MRSDAIIVGDYRYTLTREWGDTPSMGPRMTFIMLNPSTADASVDDPTIRRCIGFAKREGCERLSVVNLFAWRATDPRQLPESVPIACGPDNLGYISRAVNPVNSQVIVAAWGAHPRARAGYDFMRRWVSLPGLMCLGTTRNDSPRHPLYVKADQPLVPFLS